MAKKSIKVILAKLGLDVHSRGVFIVAKEQQIGHDTRSQYHFSVCTPLSFVCFPKWWLMSLGKSSADGEIQENRTQYKG